MTGCPLQASREVDLPMLQQLQPMVGARVRDLEAEACDANTSRGKRVSGLVHAPAPWGNSSRPSRMAPWRQRGQLVGTVARSC